MAARALAAAASILAIGFTKCCAKRSAFTNEPRTMPMRDSSHEASRPRPGAFSEIAMLPRARGRKAVARRAQALRRDSIGVSRRDRDVLPGCLGEHSP